MQQAKWAKAVDSSRCQQQKQLRGSSKYAAYPSYKQAAVLAVTLEQRTRPNAMHGGITYHAKQVNQG